MSIAAEPDDTLGQPVSVERRNFDPYRFGRRSLRRSWFLHGVDRWLGLDLYVVAVK